jgi:hypothetical protein
MTAPDDEATRPSKPKAPPPAFEDRVTVDPHPPGVDRDHARELADAPDDGPEAEPEQPQDD